MKKAAALEMFGTPARMARKMGITTQAISQWPDKLPLSVADRVRGAALRCGYSAKQVMAMDPAAPTFGED